MANYTKEQQEYIDSVDGLAHQSAITVIGRQGEQISELKKIALRLGVLAVKHCDIQQHDFSEIKAQIRSIEGE